MSLARTSVFILVTLMTANAITDQQYYSMPRLFHLDDYDECVSIDGSYCVGTFDLHVEQNYKLYDFTKQYSGDRLHFNHTRLHRGLCINTSCSEIEGTTLEDRFKTCVDRWAQTRYGLQANLADLNYCVQAKGPTWAIDGTTTGFACAITILIAANLLGTAYDVFRNHDKNVNSYLLAWSLIANWKRFTATHEDGDVRLAALKPVQGMKTLTLLLVLLAHTVFAFHLTYVYNPEFLEKSAHHPLSVYLQNGSVIIQTFIMVTSFLLAYNLLLRADSDSKKVSFNMLPLCLLHRICRISPVYMLVVAGVAMIRVNGGAQWWLFDNEATRCRDNWWTNALYINNLVGTDARCLIQTWFLAVDMQLYIVATVLTLLLIKWQHSAIKILSGLFGLSIVINFAIAYYWNHKPMLMLMTPELLRRLFDGSRSFTWSYCAPWAALPTSLLGLALAFLHHHYQKNCFKAAESSLVRILYRASVPAMFAWVAAGYWVLGATARAPAALYATLDRPVFAVLTAIATYGFFNKIDNVWWRLLSWGGWRVLGRLSLAVLAVHWPIMVALVAGYTRPLYSSVFDIAGKWLVATVLSYSIALPLTLLVELPAQRFLQIIFLGNA